LKKVEKLDIKKVEIGYKEINSTPYFSKSCRVLKENYIPKNGLYIGLHKILCNFF